MLSIRRNGVISTIQNEYNAPPKSPPFFFPYSNKGGPALAPPLPKHLPPSDSVFGSEMAENSDCVEVISLHIYGIECP
jgi:hypothetical protein